MRTSPNSRSVAVSRTLGSVIGERRLIARGARRTRVAITLGKPRLPKGERDWQCPFRISGGGIRVLEYGYGVDAIQAIQTALQGIRHFLDSSGKSLEWEGMPDGGFQRSIPWYGDSRFTKRIERLVDAELTREAARLRRRHQQRQKTRRRQSA